MSSIASPGSPITVVLGPLIPRIVAMYFSICIALIFWLPLLTHPALSSAVKAIAYVSGCLLMCCVLFPRKGAVEIDASHRMLRFRESASSWLFHFWRRREASQLSLPPNSKVLVGEWLNEHAFSTLGVKRVAADGQAEILFQRKCAFDGAIASVMIAEIQKVGAIEIEAIRLNTSFQQIKWEPRSGKVAQPQGPLFFLSFVGYPAGILFKDLGAICAVGIMCLLTFIAMTYRAKSSASSSDTPFARIRFWFRVFQFVLTFTVLAIIGAKTAG